MWTVTVLNYLVVFKFSTHFKQLLMCSEGLIAETWTTQDSFVCVCVSARVMCHHKIINTSMTSLLDVRETRGVNVIQSAEWSGRKCGEQWLLREHILQIRVREWWENTSVYERVWEREKEKMERERERDKKISIAEVSPDPHLTNSDSFSSSFNLFLSTRPLLQLSRPKSESQGSLKD